MPSRNSLVLLVALLGATGTLAHDAGPRQRPSEGDAAMERLREAIARTQTDANGFPAPRLPSQVGERERHRAFEALRAHRHQPEMEARARAAALEGEKGVAAEREAQASHIRHALGLEPTEAEALARAVPRDEAKDFVAILFASSSMPIATLRAYAVQLQKVHGVLAFRGMPGGLHKVGPMAKLSAEILRLDPGCDGPACAMRDVQLIVDPIIFRQHGITRVPALAMVPGDPTEAYCERDGQSPRATSIVYGDSALTGLLEEYARLGGRAEVRDAQALLAAR
jgi:hypothetical protein